MNPQLKSCGFGHVFVRFDHSMMMDDFGHMETFISTLAIKKRRNDTFIFDSSVATVPSVTSDDVIAVSKKLCSFSSSCAGSDPDVSITM